jgi:16S rRNA (guanine1207-N2)-methyltransferase
LSSAIIRDLDFIVMNPPFHEGKSRDTDIGADFIKTAAQALRPEGVLWMVANANLPYELTLKVQFKKADKIFEGQGFKIFRAVK